MIEIGKIVNTHGLKGDLKVEPWCDGIETFEFLDTVYVNDLPYEISGVHAHKNLFLLKLSGVDSINEAENLKGATLTAREEDMPPLEDGVFYIKDIIGLKVYDKDRYIGEIYDWIETGSANVYVVRRDNKKDVLIPGVDEFVKKIDIENKTMHVELLEGLMEDDD